MKTATPSEFIGKTAYMPTSQGVVVEVKIIGHKRAYGRDRYEVQPVSGEGTAIVEKLLFKKPKS